MMSETTSGPVKRRMSHSKNEAEDSPPLNENFMSAEPKFRYGTLLIGCLLPALLVIVAFCSKPGLIAICFGFLFAYIFDLIGAMEATILTIAATFMGLWGTTIFAGKRLIMDSIFNIPLLLTMTITLSLSFFAMAGNFRTVMNEFETFFGFMESLLFGMIPLIGSCITTWFLCVEIPYLDLSLCFCTCYFVYCLVLIPPRQSALQYNYKTKRRQYIIPFPLLMIMYIIPVIMSPVLHISLHYHVAIPTFHRIADLLLSIVYPLVLNCYLIDKNPEYYSDEVKADLNTALPIVKLFLSGLLLVCVQAHPIFDDIKNLSGHTEIVSSGIITFAMLIVMVAIYLQQYNASNYFIASDFSATNSSAMLREHVAYFIITRCVALLYVSAAYIVCRLIGMTSLPSTMIVLIGVWGMSEYYLQNQIAIKSWKQSVSNALLAVLSASAIGFTMHQLTLNTLQFLDYYLMWYQINISIQFICTFACFLTASAVLIPTLLQKQVKSGGILGQSNHNSSEDSEEDLGITNDLGNIFFTMFSFLIAVFELLVREQNWSDSGATADTVYPVYLLSITSLMFLLTSLHLVSTNVAGPPLLWFVIIIHGCKMLHLVGLSSSICFSSAALVLSTTLPFVLHAKEGWITSGVIVDTQKNSGSILIGRSDNGVDFGGDGVWLPRIGYVEGFCYLLLTASSCHLACDSVFPSLLEIILDRGVNSTQVFATATAVWFFYAALQSFVFWREASFLRSVLSMIGVSLLLISGEAFGPLFVEYNPSSIFLLSIEWRVTEGEQSSHSGVYLMIAILLALIAFAGILPIHNMGIRIVFICAFSYCAAIAAEEYVFPDAVRSDTVTLDKGIFSFPWLLSIISIFLATSTVLHVSSSQTSAAANAISTIFASIFFFALIIVFIIQENSHYFVNILWLGGIIHGTTVLFCQIIEFSKQHDPNFTTSQRNAKVKQQSNFGESVCISSGAIGFVLLALASFLTPHMPNDFFIPFASLLFASYPRDILFNVEVPSLVLSATVSSFWWLLSAMYIIFVSGREDLVFLHNFAAGSDLGFFSNADVSIWSDEPAWIVYGHIVLLICTLPAVSLSLFKRNNISEDTLFFFAIVSVLPVIASQVWSIRFLGITGALLAAWRCYDVSALQRQSDAVL